MRGFTSVLLEILRERLWLAPGLAAVAAAVAALVIVWVDPGRGDHWLSIGLEPDSARALLSGISGAMISFTALVFSVTMLVLQQASAQLSPRVMRTFLRDRFNQAVLALFVAAFVFSLFVLLDVGEDEVSGLGVLGSIALVLTAVLAFVAYIDHMAHAIRPTSVIHSIGAETRAAIDRNYPAHDERGADSAATDVVSDADRADRADRDRGDRGDRADPTAIPDDLDAGLVVDWSQESGYIQALDEERLLDHAEQAGGRIVLVAGIGEFLVRGAPLLWVDAAGASRGRAPDDSVAEAVRVGDERTMSQDPEYGFRQLVDIALRALSPSLNDPTTAILVIDELHDLLRYLVARPLPSPRVLERGAAASVAIPAPGWEAFVRLAVTEIARDGTPETAARMRMLLDDLERDCATGRQAAIRRARSSLDQPGSGG